MCREVEPRRWTNLYPQEPRALEVDEPIPTVEEEARVARTRRTPKEPSYEERRVHRLTHLPYRNWCEVCVEARGRNAAHLKGSHENYIILMCIWTTVSLGTRKEGTVWWL